VKPECVHRVPAFQFPSSEISAGCKAGDDTQGRMYRHEKTTPEEIEPAEHCRLEAETLYRSGKYHCAEAVMETLRRHFSPQTPETVLGAVSGFGGGSGSGCICGAVSGGTVAMGLVVQDRKLTADLTRRLHDWFRERYGATCCKTIRANNDKGICLQLTGEVAGKIADMLSKR
jgi:C_GCAxxG_C_C family probable redox protein